MASAPDPRSAESSSTSTTTTSTTAIGEAGKKVGRSHYDNADYAADATVPPYCGERMQRRLQPVASQASLGERRRTAASRLSAMFFPASSLASGRPAAVTGQPAQQGGSSASSSEDEDVMHYVELDSATGSEQPETQTHYPSASTASASTSAQPEDGYMIFNRTGKPRERRQKGGGVENEGESEAGGLGDAPPEIRGSRVVSEDGEEGEEDEEDELASVEDGESRIVSVGSSTVVCEDLPSHLGWQTVMDEAQRLLPSLKISYVPGRALVARGRLMKMTRKGPRVRFALLFTDIFIYAKEANLALSQYYTQPKTLILQGMCVSHVRDPVLGMSSPIRVESKEKSFLLEGETQEETDTWFALFQRCIQAFEQRSKTISRRSQAGASLAAVGAKAPVWVPDKSTSQCMVCSQEFTIFRRRHHCRACGIVACGVCCSQSMPLSYMQNKHGRVCVDCFLDLLGEADSGHKGLLAYEVRSKSNERKTIMKIKTSRLQTELMVASGKDDVVMKGFVHKKDKVPNKWHLKWMELRLTPSPAVFLYRAQQDAVAETRVGLGGFTTVSGLGLEGKDHIMILVKDQEVYCFACDTLEAKNAWVAALQPA